MDIIQKIIAAAGGEVWRRPKTLQLVGEAQFTPFGQTDKALFFDTYKMYRVFPQENVEAHTANGKVSFEALYGKELFFQLKFNGKTSNVKLADVAKPYAEHFKWSNNFGFGILRFADSNSFKIEQLVSDEFEAYPSHVIKVTDPKANETYFGVDQKTMHVRMVGFKTSVGWHHRIYSKFEKATNGFVQPTRIRIYYDGIKWMDINWKKYTINESIDDAIFE